MRQGAPSKKAVKRSKRGGGGGGKMCRRPGLCCQKLVEAAVRLAESGGIEAVSMRSLAREVGVEAMSLYSHVESKEALLGLMGAWVMDQVPTPSRRLSPRRRLCQLAGSMRAVAMAHPRVFPLVVLRPFHLESAVRPTEIALQAFVDAGHSDVRAIRSQRVFLSFVRGFVLWEIGGFAIGVRETDGSHNARALANLRALDADAFPQMHRLCEQFFRIRPEALFEDGVRWLLDTLLEEKP
ncbi:MAG: helix-turn-helix domain-containing protein [Phycisphaerales bacterium]